MLLLAGLLFSIARAQWSECPEVTVPPSDLDTVSVWTDGVVSRLGIAKPTETSTASSVTASTASVAKCSADCSFPLSTYVTTVGTQSSFLLIQEPLSFLVPGYFTRFPTNETLRCVAYQGSCGATVPLYRHYRITAFGVQHAYSFSPDISYQDFIMEGNPVCYFWPSGIAADPSGENVTEIPENDLVVLHYFDNQAIGSLRDHYATTLTTVPGYTELSPLGKVASNLSSQCDEMIALVEMVDNQTGPFSRLDHKVIVESQESNRLFEQYTPTSEKFYCVARPVCGARQPLWKMFDYINLDSVLSLTPSSTLSAYLYPNAPLCYIWAMDYNPNGDLSTNSTITQDIIDAQEGDPSLSTTDSNLLSSTLIPGEETTVGSTEPAMDGSSPPGESSSTLEEEIGSSTLPGESTVLLVEETTSLPFETSPLMEEIISTTIFNEETTQFPSESSTLAPVGTESFDSVGTTPEGTTTGISDLETGETTIGTGATEIMGSTLPQQGSTDFNPPASWATTAGDTLAPEGTTLPFLETTEPGITSPPLEITTVVDWETTVPLGSTVAGDGAVSPGLAETTIGIVTTEEMIMPTGGIMDTEGPSTMGELQTTSTIPPRTTEGSPFIIPQLGRTTLQVGSTVATGSTVPQENTPGIESTGSPTIPPGPVATQMTWESLFSSMTTPIRDLATPAATSIPTEMATTRAQVEGTVAVSPTEGPATTAGLPFINITELTWTTGAVEVATVATILPGTLPAHDPSGTTPPSSEITVIPVVTSSVGLPLTTLADSLVFTVTRPGGDVTTTSENPGGEITVPSEVVTVTGPAAPVHDVTERVVNLEEILTTTALPTRDSTDLFSLNG